MKTNTLRAAALAAITLIAGTALAAAADNGMHMGSAPPSPKHETPWAKPSSKAVWVAGHYEPKSGQWAWVAGYYSYPPKPGGRWVPGYFAHGEWHPGSWTKR